MLKLVDLKKDYALKGQESVHALKGVSVNFRRNEFVAILGPSGCGKTTLLNLVGGLDRYSSGDLIIEGKSTKNYKDHDWDTYRNHSVGFVFQAYNLIGHQSILKNVELALTISGISKKDRKQRAIDALDKVGLKGMYKKKPNQLSGGQMQRVAIARSLVNNPEILLADEPTGALDSETSVQIMDLLKEVAENRLVIMVTHNPELAEQYATRIVSMKDGVVLSDTNPYNGETKEDLEKALAAKKEIIAQKGKDKSAMSFPTATGLSFANLISKLKRTILVTVAGSIGIIGVASVLAVSQGVTGYVDKMQDDMLSSYPVNITEKAMDMTSLMTGLSSWDKKEIAETDLKNKVAVDSMITFLMEKYSDITKVKTNEINADLLAFLDDIPDELLASIDLNYNIDPTNNIFTSWKRYNDSSKEMMSLNGLTQMYVAELKTVRDFGKYAQFVSLFTDFMNQLPGGEDYVLSQYDLLGNSKFPTEANEMLLVVDNNQTLTDILFAQLGFFTEKEFLDLAQSAIYDNKTDEEKEADPKTFDYPKSFTYDEILNKEMIYYPHGDIYHYFEEYEHEVYKTVKFDFEADLGAGLMRISPNLVYDDVTDTFYGSISLGSYKLDNIYFDRAPGTPSVLEYPAIGAWTCKIDLGEVQFGFSAVLDATNEFVVTYPGVQYDAEGNPTGVEMKEVKGDYVYKEDDIPGWRTSAAAKSTWTNGMPMKIVGIAKAKETTNFGCLSRGIYYTPAFTRKYMADALEAQITKDMEAYINSAEGSEDYFFAYTEFEYSSFRKDENNPVLMKGESYCLNGSTSIASLLGVSMDGQATQANIAFLRSMSGIASKEIEVNKIKSYKFESVPESISIYPKSFETKDKVLDYLDKWNEEGDITVGGKTLSLEERDELTYTDTIGMIISVIDSLIEAITIALVAFTSLALVVSCFMIAVITYISTMERVKEIGIIRSLGGRKKDVSRLFIAECLIIGLASGVFGIIMTEVVCAILNIVVAPYGVGQIAILMPATIGIMIALSVVLNVLSGLIPSMKASSQDPVIALRSE